MNIFSRLFKKQAEAAKFSLRWTPFGFTLYSNEAQTFMDEGWLANSTVYSIINRTANKVASIPLYQYTSRSSKSIREFKQLRKEYDPKAWIQAERLKLKDLTEVEDRGDAINRLLRAPSPGVSLGDWLYFVLANKMISGGCPVYANKGLTGKEVLGMYAFNQRFIRIGADPTLTKIEKVELMLNIGNIDMKTEQFYMLRYVHPEMYEDGRHLYGYSPLRSALKVLQQDNEGNDALSFMWKHQGMKGVFTPESVDQMDALSDQATRDQLRNDLDSLLATRKTENTRNYVNAMLKYQSFGMDAKELELVEALKGSKLALAQVYDYPPPLLGLDSTTFNNMSEARKYFLTTTCRPHTQDIEAMFNDWLLPLAGYSDDRFVAFDFSTQPELQEDKKLEAEWMKNVGVFTGNEIRTIGGYDELTGVANMDVPIVPAGMVPITDLGMSDDLLLGDDVL